MPHFRVLAGPSLDQLTQVKPNSDTAVKIKSDAYDGQVAVYLKGLNSDGQIRDCTYFSTDSRANVTWSIQAQGVFLQPHSANDLMFGNVFDHPLKLPWGFSAALSFMQYLDPTLEQDLASQSKPWALSPLISTMPYLAHTRVSNLEQLPPFPPTTPIMDNISELPVKDSNGVVAKFDSEDKLNTRQSYFKTAEHRDKVTFGAEDLLTMDFCYNYLHFSSEEVTLRIPGGVTFDMMKYWDGQPVRFVCCERKRASDSSDIPWGRVFWCVSIEAVDEEIGGAQDDDID